MNFDWHYALWIQNFITDHTSQSAGTGIRASIFNRYKEATVKTRGRPTCACIMWRHYSVTCTRSLHAINGLLAVGWVGNLFCGFPSYIHAIFPSHFRTSNSCKFMLQVFKRYWMQQLQYSQNHPLIFTDEQKWKGRQRGTYLRQPISAVKTKRWNKKIE